ncbi:RHS repeat domain-containing protein, partial [Zooshikella harenae]
INFSHSGSNDDINVAQNISYLPFGPVQSLTWGNGLTLNRQYDQDFQLTSQSVQGIQSLSYGYDAVGNILSIDDGLQANLNQAFEYDALDRLALESGYFGQKTYQFDEVGNRTQRIWTTKADASGNSQTKKQVLSYHDNSNRLSKLNKETVSLDAMGNTLASRGANATYDARGRLSSMTVNGELRAKYTYNAIGERVVKERILGGQSYYGVYQYDLAGQLLAEANYSSTRKLLDRHYVWLGNMPVAMIEVHYQGDGKVANTQVSYIHADHLNTPRRATNIEGNIVWAWYSDAYGVGQVADNPDGDGQAVTLNLRFPGQYFDAESGLFYNYFRDYDPTTGRYIESDPIGLAGGLNAYAYVEGNPLRWVDPRGLAIGDYPPPPPGYDPDTWGHGQWPNGKDYVTDPDGDIWTVHPEDKGHWPHWDVGPSGGKTKQHPENAKKPWPGQKKPKKDQCETDPNGDDYDPWEHPEQSAPKVLPPPLILPKLPGGGRKCAPLKCGPLSPLLQ